MIYDDLGLPLWLGKLHVKHFRDFFGYDYRTLNIPNHPTIMGNGQRGESFSLGFVAGRELLVELSLVAKRSSRKWRSLDPAPQRAQIDRSDRYGIMLVYMIPSSGGPYSTGGYKCL